MRPHLTPRDAVRVRLVLSISLLASLCLACLAEVEGDRATTGECPPGETCSDRTPAGLTFVGHAFYDEPTLRLGPFLAGGTFELGLRANDVEGLPPFAYEVESADVMRAALGDGTFGETTADGEPLFPTDAHLVLTGVGEGTSFVRIVDRDTGELFDRIPLDVVEVEDVRLVLAQDDTRDHLYAGCDEMIGVRLYGLQGTEEVRGFDQSFALRTDAGAIADETRFWDCVIVTTPDMGDTLGFEIDVAGRTYTRTMSVVSLESDGLDACPAVSRD